MRQAHHGAVGIYFVVYALFSQAELRDTLMVSGLLTSNIAERPLMR
jgi:hypothetical protein